MAEISWNEEKPKRNDFLRELAEVVRSNKTALRAALEETFYWNDSQDSGGLLRVSTSTPGSARVFFGARSTVSHPGRDGTMMFVSDESRLLIFVDSTLSVPIGSSKAYVHKDASLVAAGGRTVVDSGVATLGAESLDNVDFNVTYSIAPDVVITPSSSDANSAASYVCSIATVSGSGFSIYNRYVGPGADPSASNVLWRSIGTVDTA
jgi:hypothetical protein